MTGSPLVSAGELASLMTSHRDELVLLDARPGEQGRRAYTEGHLAGAVHVDLDRDLAGPAPDPASGGRHPLPSLPDFARRLGEWGIVPGSRVVIYDAQGGANAAARAWWLLRSAGHEQVAVLDGGLQAALEQGLPLVVEPPSPERRPPYPASAWRMPVASADEVEERSRDAGWRVLDVRAPERYRGELEPYDPLPGHIPGARNLPYGTNLDERSRFRPVPELRRQLAGALGPVPAEHTIVHCGSGVTACHTLLAMELAGLTGAALYVGSWSEWCRSDREKAKGE